MHPKFAAMRNAGKKLTAQIDGIGQPAIRESLERAKAHIEKQDFHLAGTELLEASKAVENVGLKVQLLKMAARAAVAAPGFRNCESASILMDEAAMLKLENSAQEKDNGMREMMVGQRLLRRSRHMGVREFLEGMGGYCMP